MGFFDGLINAFKKLFGVAPNIKFDDKSIVDFIYNHPQSLSENYKESLIQIAEEIHQVYAAANSKEFTIT